VMARSKKSLDLSIFLKKLNINKKTKIKKSK